MIWDGEGLFTLHFQVKTHHWEKSELTLKAGT